MNKVKCTDCAYLGKKAKQGFIVCGALYESRVPKDIIDVEMKCLKFKERTK